MSRRTVAAVVLGVGGCLCGAIAHAQHGAPAGEWPSYGGDAGSTRYSPLAQVDAANFDDLRVIWRWDSPDAALDLDAVRERVPTVHYRMFQATPLMVGGMLYLSTPLHLVAAVDAGTGARRWVHEDYDFPAAPNLVDITVDRRRIPAVAQVSKQGFTCVFDRVTGEPVWPIEERPVATDTDLAGERLSPTQPFPTKPPPFDHQGLTIDDLVDFTPEIRALAVEAVRDFRLGPLFTPAMLHDGRQFIALTVGGQVPALVALALP